MKEKKLSDRIPFTIAMLALLTVLGGGYGIGYAMLHGDYRISLGIISITNVLMLLLSVIAFIYYCFIRPIADTWQNGFTLYNKERDSDPIKGLLLGGIGGVVWVIFLGICQFFGLDINSTVCLFFGILFAVCFIGMLFELVLITRMFFKSNASLPQNGNIQTESMAEIRKVEEHCDDSFEDRSP